MEIHNLGHTPLSLYRITLLSLVSQKNLDVCSLKNLPGHIKEDMLQFGLLQRIGNNNLSEFLHPCLTKLDTFRCQITSENLLELSSCQRLRLLVINPPKFYRFSHSTSSLNQLFSSLPYLLKLHITNNDGITDSVIAVIEKNCRMVQELDVSGNLNLTDKAATYLAGMSQLRVLNMSYNAIGDCGLEVLSQGSNAKLITHLRLDNCKNITDVGIDALIRRCENLLKLKACGWPRVSIECQLTLNSFLNRHKKGKTTWMELFLN